MSRNGLPLSSGAETIGYLPIPNAAGLYRLSFYLPMAAISRQNALGVVLSNGIDCTIRMP